MSRTSRKGTARVEDMHAVAEQIAELLRGKNWKPYEIQLTLGWAADYIGPPCPSCGSRKHYSPKDDTCEACDRGMEADPDAPS